jgi:DNA-binding ferritin-like protein
MKLDNYLSRWQEFRDWSATNRPDIVDGVETLGDELRDSIHEYREATDPATRNLRLEVIKQHYDRVVQWHMEAILSKLETE